MDAYDLIRAVMRAERVQLTQKSADTHFVHKQTLALLKAKKKNNTVKGEIHVYNDAFYAHK